MDLGFWRKKGNKKGARLVGERGAGGGRWGCIGQHTVGEEEGKMAGHSRFESFVSLQWELGHLPRVRPWR